MLPNLHTGSELCVGFTKIAYNYSIVFRHCSIYKTFMSLHAENPIVGTRPTDMPSSSPLRCNISDLFYCFTIFILISFKSIQFVDDVFRYFKCMFHPQGKNRLLFPQYIFQMPLSLHLRFPRTSLQISV